MRNTRDEALAIISRAKERKKSSNRRMNYSDYEEFKSELYDRGLYGYEKELADALGV